MKFNRVFLNKEINKNTILTDVELADGEELADKTRKENPNLLPTDAKDYMTLPVHGQGAGENTLRYLKARVIKYGIPTNGHIGHNA